MAPRITVSDDDGQLALFAGKRGYASFFYGDAKFVGSVLTESGRIETAEWLSDATDEEEPVAWLTGIEIEEGKRGKGIGTALLRRGLRELEKRNVSLVFLHAMADFGYEEQLDAWYVAHGFGASGELDGRPFYYAYLSGDTGD